MTTKLTLSMDKEIIDKAKSFAQKSGRSLSNLIESYLQSLIHADEDKESQQLPPKLKRLYGATIISLNLDHKKEIRKMLSSKHKL